MPAAASPSNTEGGKSRADGLIMWWVIAPIVRGGKRYASAETHDLKDEALAQQIFSSKKFGISTPLAIVARNVKSLV